MCRKKGDRLMQMPGPNLHEWQRAKLQGMGQHPYSPPDAPTPPPRTQPSRLSLFLTRSFSPPFFGNRKGGCDAHDCSSLSRQGSVANEGLWVSTRHFTLSASLTTPPCYPKSPPSTPPPPLQSCSLLRLHSPNQVGLISLSGDLHPTHCWFVVLCCG